MLQGGKAAHRNPDNMGLLDLEALHDVANVVAGALLRVAVKILRHIRRRITARIERDAAIAAPEKPHFCLVAAIVVGKFMNEDDRVA